MYTTPEEKDHFFMREALKEARKAFEADEVPIGAVLVYEDRIVARGHNQVELLQDATAHAEMLCLTSASSVFKNWRLVDTTLYCTVEPCTMCGGALLAARVGRLVYGAREPRQGADGSWIDLFTKRHAMHQVVVTGGVLEAEAAALLVEFFRAKRDARDKPTRRRDGSSTGEEAPDLWPEDSADADGGGRSPASGLSRA